MKLYVFCVPNTSATASGYNPSQQSILEFTANILNTGFPNHSRPLCMTNLSFFLKETFFDFVLRRFFFFFLERGRIFLDMM